MIHTAEVHIRDQFYQPLLSSIAQAQKRSTVSVVKDPDGVVVTIEANDMTSFRSCLHSLLQELTIIEKTRQIP